MKLSNADAWSVAATRIRVMFALAALAVTMWWIISSRFAGVITPSSTNEAGSVSAKNIPQLNSI